MSRSWMPALACACALTLTAARSLADEPKPAPGKGDQVEANLAILAHQEFPHKEGANVGDIPIFELLQDVSKRYNLTFVVNTEAFKAAGLQNFIEEKPRLAATQLRGMTVRQFLNAALDGLGATYLVRNNSIEIVPVEHAAKVTKGTTTQNDDGRPRLSQPLVSHVVQEKPLNETVAHIAKLYDLTVVVSPQAGDARIGFVSARLLNVPADRALELLALQADLRVVRRGAAFLITSKDHANEIFGEELEKERQKIESSKLRKEAAKPAAPPPAPVPQK